MAGVTIIPVVIRKTVPERSAYTDANILAPVDVSTATGPMPVRIIAASRMESTQLNPARKW
jgi:hypothetical protein